MEKLSLIEISRELSEIEAKLIAAEGEIPEDLEAVLNDLQANLEKKIDSYHWVIKGLESRAEVFKEEAKKYQKISRSLETRAEAMKMTIKDLMRKRSQFEIEGTGVRFKLLTTNKSLVIEDSSQIPADLKTVIVTPNNEKIKDLMLKGVIVPGCRLEENFSLRSFVKK